MTEADLRRLPRKKQKVLYRAFFSAYLSAEKAEDEPLLRQSAYRLQKWREIWCMSLRECSALEIEVIRTIRAIDRQFFRKLATW